MTLTPTTYLIATAGSHGDVLPFMALAEGLTKLGHHAIVYGTPLFAQFAPKGVRFVPVGTNELYYQALSALNDNRPLSSIRQIVAVMTRIIPLIINEMEKDIAPNQTVVIGGVMNPAPHIFAEKYRLPFVNVHLSPLAIYSVQRMGRALPILDNLTQWQNPTLNRLFWRWVDWAVFRPNFTKPINRLRADYGLAPLAVPMIQWVNQADLVLSLFDERFAPRQPDWADIEVVGFPFYEHQQSGELSTKIMNFLQEGDKPVLFCAGTATANAQQFFATSRLVCEKMGIRAIFVSHIKEQLPTNLPNSILAVDYVAYEQILPKVAVFVHHGGIGNTAVALKSGVPQLIRPCAFDQFDNASRAVSLGVAVEILPKAYQVDTVIKALKNLINNQNLSHHCQSIAQQITPTGIDQACLKIIKMGKHNDIDKASDCLDNNTK
ncbi:glycosyltransferase [Moraxella sp. ZY210820]|uniref:glycosyltransferase n=1 Tax=unclassified Moraxella TaxID=2685852 RepID=UPI00273103E5|nr:glycosyltransferase [Moraxella sp. ZY210820]WLF84563.1 glycosyltransferase [Moraxella sp. ZY210820]